MCVRGCDSSKKAERRVKTTRRSLGHPEDERLKKRLLRPCNRGVRVVKNVKIERDSDTTNKRCKSHEI